MIELVDAQHAIKPIEPALTEGLKKAAKSWETLLNDHSALALPLNPTTRANFIHDHACSEVAQLTADVAGIQVADGLQFFALRVGDDILLRMKYVGFGAPRNYATEQQKLLARQSFTQEMIVALDGITAPPTLLTCGYTIDGDEIGRVEIRRDCKSHVSWSYDIYGGSAVIAPQALPGMDDTARPAKITRKIAAEGEDAASANGAS